MNLLINLKSFDYFKVISLEVDSNNFCSITGKSEGKICGYYWQKFFGTGIYGLFVIGERIYLIIDNECFDATSVDFHAAVSCSYMIFYSFILFRESVEIKRVEYVDLFSSSKDELSSHFLSDCAHFLYGQERKITLNTGMNSNNGVRSCTETCV